MTSVKEQEAIKKLMVFLQEWDSAHRVARNHILDNFIRSNIGKTEPELELEFSQGASLFLARLAAWLRVTYMYSTCINKLLKSIGIFLSAASGRRYIIEFLEMGGVLMLLEILGLNHLNEEDKRESVKLLQLIADAGRKYKELICESYGVQSLAELLATCSSAEVRDEVQILLDSLGRGNPKYQNQVYSGLLAVLPCGSPHAQQLALQTLRSMQVSGGGKGCPQGLESPQLCQRERPGPIRSTSWGCPLPIGGRRGALHAPASSTRPCPPGPAGRASAGWSGAAAGSTGHDTPRGAVRSRPAAARCRVPARPARPVARPGGPADPAREESTSQSVLAKESAEVAEELIQLKVVHGLMVAVGNLDYPLSQRNASISLEYFVRMYPFVEEHVRKAVGDTLFQLFKDCPETWYTKIDPVQAEELASNPVDSPKDMAKMQSAEAGCPLTDLSGDNHYFATSFFLPIHKIYGEFRAFEEDQHALVQNNF
ncbi:armadillo-like helical domain containing protein 1 isoform X7 [Gallus gallus]|nr:armadillo-like helical domain containing protein 1 isoform X7 [Gallus gallus]